LNHAIFASEEVIFLEGCMPSNFRRDRPRYIEDWVDKATGKALAVDENDLWMCAQAKERGLIFVTTDARMRRIEDADPDVRLLII